VVEHCIVLDAANLVREELFVGAGASTEVHLFGKPGAVYAKVQAVPVSSSKWELDVAYRLVTGTGETRLGDSFTVLQCTRRGGGWFFLCGGVEDNCGQRVKRLYLPPGCTRFFCRRCYHLGYLSQRNSDRRLVRFNNNPGLLKKILIQLPLQLKLGNHPPLQELKLFLKASLRFKQSYGNFDFLDL